MVQSLADRVQAQTGLLWEADNVHAEATAAGEVKLQTQVEAAQEVQRVKEAMARQAQKEATNLKKKLYEAERKAKDVAADLQVVIEGKFPRSPRAGSVCFTSSWC
jgi:23S rRNA maturation-related 3'-5' exoribonuclease YhaM